MESGTAEPNGASFTPLQILTTEFDAASRKAAEFLKEGDGALRAVTRYSYDGAGRLDCTAQRMDPASFGSAAGACAQASAADRITRAHYDAAGALVRVQTGYGTAQVRDEVRYERTANGQLKKMLDAKGNITSSAFDGFDRLLRTCYNATPEACQANSAADYVQLNYDADGRLQSRTIRGAPTTAIAYSYDNLDRVTSVEHPGTGPHEADVTYAYDNLGRMLSATDSNGRLVSYDYDALGRVTREGDQVASRTMQYDAAGQLTRLGWHDGLSVTYTYDGAGEMAGIYEGGTALLASFAYDGLGRRTSLTRGNGVVTSYSHATALGMSRLANDLAGTNQDQQLDFTYTPAGQIKTREQSNNVYAWSQYYNVDRPYAANALNQYTQAGAVVPSYDAKGNLVSAGTASYAYNSRNQLISNSASTTSFHHDPLGRLATIATPSGLETGFHYAGAQIVTETARPAPGQLPAIIRRYVYGPGPDEVLVWYEGAGTGGKRWLTADERGSIVAVTDAAGAAIAINSYDDYGIPATTNMGRFQYTGQAWIPELRMYSYKARIYSPTLGRFMQTDPAGYPDGPNWYAYVRNDPINATDPSGQACFRRSEYEIGETVAAHTVVCFEDGPGEYYSPRQEGGGAAPTKPPPNKKKPQKEKPSTLEKAKQCAADQLGLDDLADVGAAVSGFNVLETRGKFAGAVPGTSPASRGASAVFGQTRLPFQLPTIVGNPLTLSAGIRATSSVARIVGRGIPVVGWGLLAYDAAKIAACVASDD